MQDRFSRNDHVLFDLPLAQQLLTAKKSQKHWVSLAMRYYKNTGKRLQGPQTLLTKYFTCGHRNKHNQAGCLDPLLLEDPPNINQ